MDCMTVFNTDISLTNAKTEWESKNGVFAMCVCVP